MFLNDWQILSRCENQDLVIPYVEKQEGYPSYGLSSSGYDVRLDVGGYLAQEDGGGPLDPRINSLEDGKSWVECLPSVDPLMACDDGVITMKPHEMILVSSLEWINMPDDLTATLLGKSTYARLGLLVNATPLEPGWRGRITIELTNLSSLPLTLIAGHGIAQILFSQIVKPLASYGLKAGKRQYQDQDGIRVPGIVS